MPSTTYESAVRPLLGSIYDPISELHSRSALYTVTGRGTHSGSQVEASQGSITLKIDAAHGSLEIAHERMIHAFSTIVNTCGVNLRGAKLINS